MKVSVLAQIIVGVLLVMVINRMAYFGFTTNYSLNCFSRTMTEQIYTHEVYRYRFLCRYILYDVDKGLGLFMDEQGASQRLLYRDPYASNRFYAAIYYLNTFFMILTVISSVLTLDIPQKFIITNGERLFFIFFIAMIVALSSYVIVFYDTSSYFFQVLMLYVYFKFIDRHFWRTIGALGILTIISTTNRESSALSVSILSLLLLTKFGATQKSLMGIATIAGCFIITYLGLHLFLAEAVYKKAGAVPISWTWRI